MKRARAYSRQTIAAAELLGLQIRQHRLERAIPLRELAERAGITAPTMSRIERGDPSVGLGVALEAATIVGVPLFVEEPSRLAPELRKQRDLIALLPERARRPREADVDDDF